MVAMVHPCTLLVKAFFRAIAGGAPVTGGFLLAVAFSCGLAYPAQQTEAGLHEGINRSRIQGEGRPAARTGKESFQA